MKNIYSMLSHFIHGPQSLSELASSLGNEYDINSIDFLKNKKLLVETSDGQLMFDQSNGKYLLGRFRPNPKGFGFVSSLDQSFEDYYVDEKFVNQSINNDIVLFETKKSTTKKGSYEAKIFALVERSSSSIVATVFKIGNTCFGKPDNSKLFFEIHFVNENEFNLVDGHKTLVKLLDQIDEKHFNAEIIEILGHKNDPGVDILSTIYEHGITIEFSDETLLETEKIPQEINPDDFPNRTDLRGKTIITIDGEESKDLDDAVSISRINDDQFNLSVHIADVSHYIPKGSFLDIDAYERGTSVYLADRVIPMIPHALSNGICSLNPQVNRLALTCDMIFDKKGNLVSYKFYESIIQTTERMTYTDVTKILQNDKELKERYKNIYADVKLMEEFSNILRKKRTKAGSISFDVKESKLVLDEYGKVSDITFRDRNVAEMIIEDFMLAANETVASHFANNKIPSVYRVHERPNARKVETLTNFLSTYGHNLSVVDGSIVSADLQKILDSTSSLEEGTVISRIALRTMQQAKYSPENIGHYGLGIGNYTHFTSPIRRYPDLMIHRLIKNDIAHPKQPEHYENIPYLLEACEQSSLRERRAVSCERAVMELKKSEYMLDKVNNEYVGIISSVTKFGIFVELENTVEGLIHIRNLGDEHFVYDEKNMSFFGKTSKKRYSVGDKVLIRVAKIDEENHKVDFDLLKVLHSPYKEFVSRNKRNEKGSKNKDKNKKHYTKNKKNTPFSKNNKKKENSFSKSSSKPNTVRTPNKKADTSGQDRVNKFNKLYESNENKKDL